MASVLRILYRQTFINTDTIIVAHNLNKAQITVRVLIDGVAATDVISNVKTSSISPLDELIVTLTSAQSGVVQLLENDIVSSPTFGPDEQFQLDNLVNDTYKVRISADDTTEDFLELKVSDTTTISASVVNPGGAETISFDAANSTALWNASQIQGIDVTATPPNNGELLRYNSTSGDLEFVDLESGFGETNTASNINVGGVGVYAQKISTDLQFKGINAGSSKISVTDDPINFKIDIDVNEISISHLNIGDIGTNTHVQIDSHIASISNPHNVLATQITDFNTEVSNNTNVTANTAARGLVYVSLNDTTPDYLGTKLVAGTNITITENNDGSNETLTIDYVASNGVYGQEFEYFESLGITTNSTINWVDKISDVTSNKPAGTYKVSWSYGWNHDRTQDDFESQVLVDGAVYSYHKQEPKDSLSTNGAWGNTGTDQRFYAGGFFYVTFTNQTSHTMKLRFRSNVNGINSGIWETRIEVIRVA